MASDLGGSVAAETSALIRLQGVAGGYGRRAVVSGVDLEIHSGQYWFLLGPNGSGKTTLLRILLGLLPPHCGHVWLDPERAHTGRIGYVPQRATLNPALPTTVREFVTLGTIGSDRPRSGRESDLAWALARMGLSGMERRNFWSLSGGQRQRALVARALIRRPSILVLDEPTEGLDTDALSSLLATLDDLHSEGATLILVTHRMELAELHATHVARVTDGRVSAGPVPAAAAASTTPPGAAS